MNDIIVSKLTKRLTVRYDGGCVSLPADLQKEVDAYWGNCSAAGSGIREARYLP